MAVIPRSQTRQRLPPWFARALAPGGESRRTTEILRQHGLSTVCEEANCPNRNECYSKRVATFLLMGHICTRTCSFCDVATQVIGLPLPDPDEPERVAAAVGELGLDFVVLTSVNRDDLPTGGAEHFAATIGALRRRNPAGKVEVLTPDFCGNWDALAIVVAARPEVYNHNLETVPRLYRTVRPQADYRRSLELLRRVKELDSGIFTKSGIMVGLGESDDEVRWLMDDLRAAGVDIFTIGQYLRPSLQHHDILRFVTPEQFAIYEQWGREAGFAAVAAGPYVRSSHFAEEVLAGAAGAAG
jgi:lipoyl synthase